MPVLTTVPRDVYGEFPPGDYVAIHADAARPFAVRVPYRVALQSQRDGTPFAHWSLLTDAERDLVWSNRDRIVAGRF